jgi:hypothetical protein
MESETINSNGMLPRKNDPAQVKPFSHGTLSPVNPNEESAVGMQYSNTGKAHKANMNMGMNPNQD